MIKGSELKALGFELTHEYIAPSKDSTFLPAFKEVATDPSLNKSSVYLWRSFIPSKLDSYVILYLGKAGYGTTRRFSQQRAGFRKNSPGSNCALILEKFVSGRKIFVFGRVADEIELFGVTISLY